MSTIHGMSTDGTNNYRLQETNASHVDIGIGTDLETYVASQKSNLLTQYDNALYSVGRGSQAVVDALDNGDILMALTTEEAADFRAGMNAMSEQTQVCRNLLDIFRAGGVSNPDWSVMKAELQGWVNTQFNNVPKLSTDNTFSGTQNVYDIVSTGYRRKPNTTTPYTAGSAVSTARYWDFSFVDDNKTILSDFLYSVSTYSNSSLNLTNAKLASLSFRVNRGNHGYGLNNSVSSISYQSVVSDIGGLSWMIVPNIPNFDDFPTGAINVTTLNNLGNSVVHKNGTETLAGVKTFSDTVNITNQQPQIHYHLKKTGTDFGDVTGYLSSDFYKILNKDGSDTVRNIGSHVYSCSASGISDWDYLRNYTSNSISDTSYEAIQVQRTLNNSEKYFSISHLNGSTLTGYFVVDIANKAVVTSSTMSNQVSLGSPTKLWKDVYAGNGTIQTSDKRLKTEISDIPDAVMRAWSKVKFKQFKMKDAVDKKKGNARIHIGCIANEDADSVLQAFASEGLYAARYGLFCYDEWEDQYEDVQVMIKPEKVEDVKIVDVDAIYNTVLKEDGTEEQVLVSPEKFHVEQRVTEAAEYRTERKLVKSAGSQYSLRYEECLALECAYQRWKLEQLEARLNG